eukprot:m.93903 g.93903  ORF g.93903 m.93903 type:complete len:619 (-) comp13415_c0_seq1:130-1986(-)
MNLASGREWEPPLENEATITTYENGGTPDYSCELERTVTPQTRPEQLDAAYRYYYPTSRPVGLTPRHKTAAYTEQQHKERERWLPSQFKTPYSLSEIAKACVTTIERIGRKRKHRKEAAMQQEHTADMQAQMYSYLVAARDSKPNHSVIHFLMAVTFDKNLPVIHKMRRYAIKLLEKIAKTEDGRKLIILTEDALFTILGNLMDSSMGVGACKLLRELSAPVSSSDVSIQLTIVASGAIKNLLSVLLDSKITETKLVALDILKSLTETSGLIKELVISEPGLLESISIILAEGENRKLKDNENSQVPVLQSSLQEYDALICSSVWLVRSLSLEGCDDDDGDDFYEEKNGMDSDGMEPNYKNPSNKCCRRQAVLIDSGIYDCLIDLLSAAYHPRILESLLTSMLAVAHQQNQSFLRDLSARGLTLTLCNLEYECSLRQVKSMSNMRSDVSRVLVLIKELKKRFNDLNPFSNGRFFHASNKPSSPSTKNDSRNELQEQETIVEAPTTVEKVTNKKIAHDANVTPMTTSNPITKKLKMRKKKVKSKRKLTYNDENKDNSNINETSNLQKEKVEQAPMQGASDNEDCASIALDDDRDDDASSTKSETEAGPSTVRALLYGGW